MKKETKKTTAIARSPEVEAFLKQNQYSTSNPVFKPKVVAKAKNHNAGMSGYSEYENSTTAWGQKK